jgi:YgiT-type zinc finger domain-containing protein
MNCFFCKGAIQDGCTTYVADLGTCVIVVRNVPCHKCAQCGGVSYSLDVGGRIEEIVAALKDSITEVAIVKYSDHAA